MAKVEKQKKKLIERIAFLENELRTSLQKKANGPAISVPTYMNNINELKNQLANLK